MKLYHGVTLGARSFQKDEHGKIKKGGKRHPTVEDDVTIYPNSTILGGDTVIGARSDHRRQRFSDAKRPAGFARLLRGKTDCASCRNGVRRQIAATGSRRRFEAEMIYLDYNATTPLCAEARDAMLPYLERVFRQSIERSRGRPRSARRDRQCARSSSPRCWRAKPHEIIFTSGGTESNNLAVLGLARSRSRSRETS